MRRRAGLLVLVVLALVALVGGIVALVARVPDRAPTPRVQGGRLPGPRVPVGTASPAAHQPAADGGCHVEGTVRDALTSAPVAGVDVVFAAGGAEATTTSDGNGHFAVDLAAGRYLVRASGEGVYGLAPAPLALGVATRVATYDLIVARLATVRGRVVDAEGQAAPGATVTFRSQSPRGLLGSVDLDAAGLPGTASSGADGAFELRVVPGEVTLAALRAGRRGRLVLPMVAAGQSLAGAELVLDAGGGVAGVVHDPEGRPVARAQVVAVTVAGPGGLPARASTTSDENGRFTLRDLPPGPASLEARAAGFAPSAPTDAESAPDAAGREVVLTLRPARALRGRVLGPDGKPFEGARVIARRAGSNLESPSLQSGADGSFVFAALDAGPHELDASAEGYGSAYQRGVSAPADGIELRLQAMGGLSGVVSDGRGKPVADFLVRWVGLRLGGDAPTREGENRFLAADGAFQLDGLMPGDYDVVVAAPGHAPAGRRVTILPAAYADASVRLSDGATLAGRVVGPDGAPVAGAQVEVMTGHEGDAIQTDEDGRFVLADIAPGRRSLMVEHPAFVSRSESGLVLRAGERSSVEVKLTPLGPGDATHPGAHPVEFAGIGAVLKVHADGVLLQDLVPGGPAERAGLVPGDLVVTVDGESVRGRTLGDITEEIRGVVGTSVRLEVIHGGQSRILDVVRGNVRFGG